MGGVEVPQAPREWGEEGVSPSPRSTGRVCPLPGNFSYFLKIPHFDAL